MTAPAVAQGGGLERRVELVGLGTDPVLVHLGDALATALEEPAGTALLGEQVRVADSDDRRIRSVRADVGHDRLVAVDAVLRCLAGQGVQGALDRLGDILIAAAAGRREEALLIVSTGSAPPSQRHATPVNAQPPSPTDFARPLAPFLPCQRR